MKQQTNHRDGPEIDGNDGGRGKRIDQTALEDDVHVHQAVADDRVAESQRNQRQRKRGSVHPARRHNPGDERHDEEQEERQASGQRADRDPLELLAQQAARGPAITGKKDGGGEQEIRAPVREFELIEPEAARQRRNEIERRHRHADVQQQEGQGQCVNSREPPFQIPDASFGKYESEMNQKRRLKQQGGDVAPVNYPVKRIQFTAVVKRVKNERHEAENVEMHRARRRPALDDDERADEKIQQREDSQVIPDRSRIFFGRSNQLGLERLAISQ